MSLGPPLVILAVVAFLLVLAAQFLNLF